MILLYVVIALGLLLAIWALIPGYTPIIRDQQGRRLIGSIASLEKVSLGNKPQWILIRGTDRKNPIILFLHGGPGTADMTLLRRYMGELEKHFMVVTWDQRGAGKSYKAIDPASSMNINQFVEDTLELTEILRNRFHQEKIFLAGHSWGTVIGVLAVKKHPELFHAYIGIGQIANLREGELLSYQWTLEQARKAGDSKAVKKLIDIGEPPYTGDWLKKFLTQRRYLSKYHGEIVKSSFGASLLVFGSVIKATEYTLGDKLNFLKGVLGSVRLLAPELITVNLIQTAPELKLPVFFLLGRHDHEVPCTLAEYYFNSLKAPHKELIWFENSAHLPNIEENKKFTDLLINHVLPITPATFSTVQQK